MVSEEQTERAKSRTIYQLLDAVVALLDLRFKHWPLMPKDLAHPLIRETVVPILPLLEDYHARFYERTRGLRLFRKESDDAHSR